MLFYQEPMTKKKISHQRKHLINYLKYRIFVQVQKN